MEQKDKSDVCIWRMTTTSDHFQIQMFPELIYMYTEFCLICLKHEIMTIFFWSWQLPRDDKKAGRCVGSDHEKHAVRMSLRCHWWTSFSFDNNDDWVYYQSLFRQLRVQRIVKDCESTLRESRWREQGVKQWAEWKTSAPGELGNNRFLLRVHFLRQPFDRVSQKITTEFIWLREIDLLWLLSGDMNLSIVVLVDFLLVPREPQYF